MWSLRPSTRGVCLCLLAGLTGVAAESSASRLFITDASSTSKIWKTAIDGTSQQAVMTDSATQYPNPTGIGINEKTKQIYFAADDKIWVADLDGGNIAQFRGAEGYDDITSIIVDAVDAPGVSYLYLSDAGTQKIQKCDLSQTYGTESVVEFKNIKPYDMAMHYDAGDGKKRIYWTDYKNSIYRVDIDGNNMMRVAAVKSGTPNFRGISLAPNEGTGYVYYTDGSVVRRSPMASASYPDTTHQQVLDVSGSGLTDLYDLEIDSEGGATAAMYLLDTSSGKLAKTTVGASPSAPTTVTTLTTAVKGLLLYNPLPAVTTSFTPAGSTEPVSPAQFSLVEGGVKVPYSIVLDRPPANDVTVALTSTAAINPSPAAVTFTSANWNAAQAVMVQATHNDVVDGVHSVPISHACTSADSTFNSLTVPDVVTSISDNQLEKLFWTDRGDDTIKRSNIAGTGIEVLFKSNTPYPLGIAVERLQQKIYWVDKGVNGVAPVVQESLIDGTNRDTALVTMAGVGLAYPTDVVASSAIGGLGKVYWIDSYNSNPALRSADLDGSNAAVLLSGTGAGLSKPYSLVLDEFHKLNSDGVTYDMNEARLYWLDESLKEINYVKANCLALGGCTKTLLLALSGVNQPKGMCLDRDGRMLYFVDKNLKKVYSVTMPTDGSFPAMNAVTVTGTGASAIEVPIDCAVNHLTDTIYLLDIRPPGAIIKASLSADGKAASAATKIISGTGSSPHGLAVFVDLPGVTLSQTSTKHLVPGSKHETVGEKRTWKATMTVGEGSTDALGADYNVVLDMQPLQSVTVDIVAVHNNPCTFNGVGAGACEMKRGTNDGVQVGSTDYTSDAADFVGSGDQSSLTITPAQLTFTTANWRTPQTVNVFADDDQIAQGVRVVKLMHSANSGDAKYTDTNMAELTVTVVEDDRFGITSTASNVAMAEKESADFGIKLDSQPYNAVTVTVEDYHHGYSKTGKPMMGGDHSKLNFTPGTLTFTPTNWQSVQTVTVGAVDDQIAQGFRRPTIQFRASSADARYHRLPNAFSSVVANVTEDDVPGVTLSLGHVTAYEYGGCRRVQVGCDFHTTNCAKVGLQASTATNLVMGDKLINAKYPLPPVDPNKTAINRTYCPGSQPSEHNGLPDMSQSCGAHKHAGGKCVWSGSAVYRWYNSSRMPTGTKYVPPNLETGAAQYWISTEYCGNHGQTGAPTRFPTPAPTTKPTAAPTNSSRRHLLTTTEASRPNAHLPAPGSSAGDTVPTIFSDPGVQVDEGGALACKAVCECSGVNPVDGLPWLNENGADCAWTATDWDLQATCEVERVPQAKLGTYTVRLETVPYHTVTVEVVSDDPSQVFVQPSRLIFKGTDSYTYDPWDYVDSSAARPPNNNAALAQGVAGIVEQTVYVFAQDDYVTEATMNVTIRVKVLSDDVTRAVPSFTTDPAGDGGDWRCIAGRCDATGYTEKGYAEIDSYPNNITVTVHDNDKPEVLATAATPTKDWPSGRNSSQIGLLTVTENIASVFNVSLATRPATDCDTECTFGAVTVDVHRFVDPQDHSQMTLSPAQLVFTSGNWHIPQQVLVTAEDDNIEQGPRTSTLHFTTTSGDRYYDKTNSFGALAGLRAKFPPGNKWAKGVYASIHDENLNAYGTNAPVVQTYTLEDDIAGVDLSETKVLVEECEDRFKQGLISFEAGLAACEQHMLDNFTVTLRTRPYNPVTVTLIVGNNEACVAGEPAGYAKECEATMVQLKVVPSELVFGGNMDCKRGAGCIDTTTNFTGDWYVPQSVMVIAAENALNDGERFVNVSGRVASNDTCLDYSGCRKSVYNRYQHIVHNETSGEVTLDEMRGVTVPFLQATVQDNEVAAVTITPFASPLGKGEYHPKPEDIRVSLLEGQSTKYNIKLSVLPSYPVTIIPIVSDKYQLSVEPKQIVFTKSDWWQDKAVTVLANANFVHDFARNQSVSHVVYSNETGLAECTTASQQGNGVLYVDAEAPCKIKYNGTQVGAVYLQIADDDTSGVQVHVPPPSKDELIKVTDTTLSIMVEGSSASYDIVLTSEPIADVSIDLVASLLSAGSSPIAWENGDAKEDAKLQMLLLPNKVLFTKADWNKPRKIIMVARDNGVYEGFEARELNISHTSFSTDPNYHQIPIAQISINITDDDSGCQLDSPVSDPSGHGQGTLPATKLEFSADGGGPMRAQYSCVAYMSDGDRASWAAENTDLATAANKGITHCAPILPRATSPGIFGRPNRPPPNSVFLHQAIALLENAAGVAGSDKIALAKLSTHPFAKAYLSGGVCRCSLGRGGRDCMFTEKQFQRLEMTIEAEDGFDVSFTNGRSWTALALSLGVNEKDVYIVEVRPSYCMFSFYMHCVEVVVDLSGPAYKLDVMTMVQTSAPNVKDLQIKDIHLVSNYPSGGLLVGNSVYPLSSVSALLFMAWLTCSCYYGCKKGKAERKKVAAIKKDEETAERKRREQVVDPLMGGNDDEEQKEEER